MNAFQAEFDNLVTLLPRPVTPSASQGDWASIVMQSGFDFPLDYRHFLEVYGKGVIEPLGIWIANPIRKLINIDTIRDQHLRQIDSSFPYQFYPDKDGLFPWGGSNSNHYFFWTTRDDLQNGDIVVTLDCCEWSVHRNTSFVQFILFLLKQSPLGFSDSILEPLEMSDSVDFFYRVIE